MGALVDLSEREKRVLQGIAEDKTYAVIAHEMGVSYDTVKSYANRLRAKIGVRTKTGLAMYAQNHLNAG